MSDTVECTVECTAANLAGAAGRVLAGARVSRVDEAYYPVRLSCPYCRAFLGRCTALAVGAVLSRCSRHGVVVPEAAPDEEAAPVPGASPGASRGTSSPGDLTNPANGVE